MGFAYHKPWIAPKTGVYMLKKKGDLIHVTESTTTHFLPCNVYYFKGQKKPRWINALQLQMFFEYLGEL